MPNLRWPKVAVADTDPLHEPANSLKKACTELKNHCHETHAKRCSAATLTELVDACASFVSRVERNQSSTAMEFCIEALAEVKDDLAYIKNAQRSALVPVGRSHMITHGGKELQKGVEEGIQHAFTQRTTSLHTGDEGQVNPGDLML